MKGRMDSGVGTSEVHVFAYIAVVLKVFSPPLKTHLVLVFGLRLVSVSQKEKPSSESDALNS